MDSAFLANVPLFASFSLQERNALSENLIRREFNRGDFLFKQGTPAQAMFLIQSGQVTLMSRDRSRNQPAVRCGPQTLLGEVDLLLNQPYQNTALVEGVVEAWILTRSAMVSMIRAWPEITPKLTAVLGQPIAISDGRDRHTGPHTANHDAIDQIDLSTFPLFANLTPKQAAAIGQQAQLKSVSANETIFTRGAFPDLFYLLLRGQVKLINQSGHINLVRQGGFFGEMSLLTGQPYQMTAQAVEECDLLLFTRQQFETLINQYPAISFVLNRTLSARLLRANTQIHSRQALASEMAQIQAIESQNQSQNQSQSQNQNQDQKGSSSSSKFWSRVKMALFLIPLMWLAGIVAPTLLLNDASNPEPIEPNQSLQIEITPTPSPTPDSTSMKK